MFVITVAFRKIRNQKNETNSSTRRFPNNNDSNIYQQAQSTPKGFLYIHLSRPLTLQPFVPQWRCIQHRSVIFSHCFSVCDWPALDSLLRGRLAACQRARWYWCLSGPSWKRLSMITELAITQLERLSPFAPLHARLFFTPGWPSRRIRLGDYTNVGPEYTEDTKASVKGYERPLMDSLRLSPYIQFPTYCTQWMFDLSVEFNFLKNEMCFFSLSFLFIILFI